jgi:hypothetical protein
MVKLIAHCAKTTDNVSKTFSVSQLSKCHTQKLIEACKRANPVIAFIPADTLTKFVFGQKAHDLRKDRAAMVHIACPSGWI